jgi:serine/threonine protein kinase
MSLWGGLQRLGKYELREKLGHGGVAEVWKAFDTELHRYVAIKVLHADLQTDPEFMTRFSREARLVASLHHPNIVQIYDFQTIQSLETNVPIAYMVMDYVDGETLARYLYKTSRAGQFLSPTDIIHLFASIGKAIDYAHREGMIHRDIKPANILLDKRNAAPDSMGEPVLTDFGIARIVGTSSDTISGMVLGTPLYVSPEQAQGYPLTKRSDIYSLGVILYEICTGVCPFRSESVTAVLLQQVTSAPTPPAVFNPAIPPALTAVILCAMAKDPAERFDSASALTAAIAEAFHLPVPAGLFLSPLPSGDLLRSAYLSLRQSDPSPYRTVQEEVQQSQSPPVMDALPQTPSSAMRTRQLTGSPPASGAEFPVISTSSTPASLAHPSAEQNAQATPLPPVSDVKFPPTPPFLRTVRSRRAGRGNLLAWLVALFVLVGATLVSLITLANGRASPASAPETAGTLTFTDTGQYDPNLTVGYNDIVTLSLHGLTTPQTGNAYFVWLMPDQGDDGTIPILLGRLSVNAGNATLRYVSPAHTNLLAQYSGVRITEQPADNDPSDPSLDPMTWRWQGWVPHTPTPGDPNQFSMLSHFRHLLAKDPTLQKNQIPGGLLIWMTRDVGKVAEWSSAAQGGWGSQMPDGDAELIHRNLVRILDYLDGQTYVGQDVPAGSPWFAEPSLPAKFGLLSYTQDQQPPGYLQHVNIHLTGLVGSPNHTEEQKKVAIQVDRAIARMINDLTQVRKDAVQLVQRNDDQLRQPDTFTMLNEMATLTREVNSGWFDATTHDNEGGVIWIYARIQQLATISLEASTRQ